MLYAYHKHDCFGQQGMPQGLRSDQTQDMNQTIVDTDHDQEHAGRSSGPFLHHDQPLAGPAHLVGPHRQPHREYQHRHCGGNSADPRQRKPGLLRESQPQQRSEKQSRGCASAVITAAFASYNALSFAFIVTPFIVRITSPRPGPGESVAPPGDSSQFLSGCH